MTLAGCDSSEDLPLMLPAANQILRQSFCNWREKKVCLTKSCTSQLMWQANNVLITLPEVNVVNSLSIILIHLYRLLHDRQLSLTITSLSSARSHTTEDPGILDTTSD